MKNGRPKLRYPTHSMRVLIFKMEFYKLQDKLGKGKFSNWVREKMREELDKK